MRKFIDIVETRQEYHSDHHAPGAEDGAALYDLTQNDIYPDDVYSANGLREYGRDAPGAYATCMAYRGRPNKFINVYRAVPKEVKGSKLNPGDWVTLERQYAKEHGFSNLGNDYKIIKALVCARDLYSEGNSLDEWGYDPQPLVPREQEDALRVGMGMISKTEARRLHAERYLAKKADNATDT